METKKIKEFFEVIGEIWRDITMIEFLMRCALAQKEGDIDKLPKPPYSKGKIYQEYPKSFSFPLFGDVVAEFNKKFPQLAIPSELIYFRNAMAHGLISQINYSGVDELIKFRKMKDATLMVEFSMSLDLKRLQQIRQSIAELRHHIGREAADKSKS